MATTRAEILEAIQTYGIEKDNIKSDVAEGMGVTVTNLDVLLNRFRIKHNFRPNGVTKLVAKAIKASVAPAYELVEKYGVSYTTVFNIREGKAGKNL